MISLASYFKPSSGLYILLFALIFSSSQANDIFFRENSIVRHKPNLTITIKPNDHMRKDFEDIKTYTENLLSQGVQPKSILLILDVDGTVTNFSNPKESPDLKSIGTRGNSISFVENMISLGVNIVFTSANPSFEKTLELLNYLGLGETLQIKNTESYIKNSNHMLFDNICTKFCHLGLVASISYCDTSTSYFSTPYYYQKAFSYKLVCPHLQEDTITHVIFGDDSEQAGLDFGRDFNLLKTQGLFTTAIVKLFTLSYARGESYLK